MFYSVQLKLLFHTSYAEGIEFIHSVLFNINKVQWYRKHNLLTYWLLWSSALKALAQWSLSPLCGISLSLALKGVRVFPQGNITEMQIAPTSKQVSPVLLWNCIPLPRHYFVSYFKFERECYFKFTLQHTLALNFHLVLIASRVDGITYLLNQEISSSCFLV